MRPVDDTLAFGMALLGEGKLAEAERSFRKVLRRERRHFGALNLLAAVLIQLRRHAEAEPYLRAALAIDPKSEATLYNYGTALIALKRPAEAVECFDKALAISPDNAETLLNRGVALRDAERAKEALADFDRALELKPDYPEALSNRGAALFRLGRVKESLAAYEAALQRNPRLAEAWCGRGTALNALARYEDALTAYDTALRLDDRLPGAWYGRGEVLMFRANESAAAIEAFDRSLELDPDHELARRCRLFAQMQIWDWRGYEEEVARLSGGIKRGEFVLIDAFLLLAVSSSAAEQFEMAKLRRGTPSSDTQALPPRAAGPRERIRVGYLSYDLREHAVAFLAAGMFERHDRSRFETTAFSFSPDDSSDTRARLVAAFDHFVDVSDLDAEQTAALVREREIDIAVDLMGLTGGERASLFGFRPAPLQVTFLGYPSTTGIDGMDYVIADRTVIPPGHAEFFTEKVVYLPDSYQPNDDRRETPDFRGSRTDAGLPEAGFLFCCFNSSYKVTPAVFDSWMRILAQVEGSALWLLQDEERGRSNLRREAERRGVSGARLVFAPRVSPREHLARHRLADLFLDTLPYNAHTTASDALWMGLPVVTRIGTTFAGRVAASLLRSAGVPELIADSAEEYETLAVKLAREPAFLAAIRAKLAQNRAACPLFDTARFTRHIEAAYTTMWERHLRGEPPGSFAVDPIP